ELAQQALFPAACARQLGDPPRPGGEAGCLRVDEPRGLLLPWCRPLRLQAGEAIAHEVGEPEVEQLDAVLDARLALGRPLGLRLRIGRRFGSLLALALLLCGRGTGATHQPFAHPFGRVRVAELCRIRRSEDEETEGVLAGQLAARAGAFRRQVGAIDA